MTYEMRDPSEEKREYQARHGSEREEQAKQDQLRRQRETEHRQGTARARMEAEHQEMTARMQQPGRAQQQGNRFDEGTANRARSPSPHRDGEGSSPKRRRTS